MTISTLPSSIQVAGNSISTLFTFPFVGNSSSVITVSSVASNGQITLLSPTTYSVTLNPPAINQLWGVGGQIIYPLVGPALPIGQSLIISRVLPYSQQITTQNQGNYYAQVTEQALDTMAMQIQQLAGTTTQFRGIWITGVVYNAGDIVQDGVNGNGTNNYYICSVPNTSGVWATDLAAGDWKISALAAVPTGMLSLTGDVTGSGSSPIVTTLESVNSNVGTFTNATVTVSAKGLVTAVSAGSSGSGTVSNVTFTGDGTVLSSTPSSAVTATGTLTGTLLSQAKNTVLAGPTTGSNAAPTYRAIVPADISGTTGSGNVVLATSPTLVTPVLGMPASGNLSNCTNVPTSIMTPLGVGSIVLATTGTLKAAGGTIAGSSLTTFLIGTTTGTFTTGGSDSAADSLSGTWQALQSVPATVGGNTTIGLWQRTV